MILLLYYLRRIEKFYSFLREDPKSNQGSMTPSAAAVRDFNGTNRSDTVSHLQKMSYRGYGSSSGESMLKKTIKYLFIIPGSLVFLFFFPFLYPFWTVWK